MDASLRGKCEEYARAACEKDPSLRLVRGWYFDVTWGRQEHWWCQTPDGTIVDPTWKQFPFGGIESMYEEYEGVFPCMGCGAEVHEDDPERYESNCSSSCYGRMVGIY